MISKPYQAIRTADKASDWLIENLDTIITDTITTAWLHFWLSSETIFTEEMFSKHLWPNTESSYSAPGDSFKTGSKICKRIILSQPCAYVIGHVRYINILTWLRGFQVKALCLVLFSLYLSLLWELRDKGNLKNLQFWPESLGAMLEYWYIERGLFKTVYF